MFNCPSDREAKQMSSTNPQARSSYCVCMGDGWNNNYFHNGVFRGMFGTLIWYDMSSCSDGTSNTAMMSEMALGDASSAEVVSASPQLVKSAAIRLGAKPATPQTCLNYKNGTKVTGTSFNMWRGNTRFSGRPVDCGGFTTVLSPNSPSCGGYSPTSNYYFSGLMSVTSNHSGGVNVAKFDGSVAFVSETVDCGDLTTTDSPTVGPSPYGVWGAFGTRDGGESKSL
jgi:prepilin-type processing-associated H-X9-DG protein